ncbi:hypothetical protein SAMN05444156_1673 [Verrucomicrobium sp. GAS474]|uniref:hypothetical protein n=1 Tax=Verrucomicrobium sp. GAS474 TaxID=1882831 RepID=UPI00087C8AA1|nr:hypothetical protein [Verrucomicrobium sp. GAS474]SDU05081.1 hypothetical protein SAMN05444156_1673 [Verrucomicrobium sp. GAS474]
MSANTSPDHLLEVIGTGAVGPAGCGVAFLDAPPPAPTLEPLLSRTEPTIPVRRVNMKEEALLRWQKEPRLRRASPLSYFLVEAAAQALAGTDLPRERIGLVCAVSTGSVVYSRKFFADTLRQGRRLASPALFPETVYNSPVSHVAAVHRLCGACSTLVGDETAWVDALRVAQVWLARETADAVLVIGGEELDALALEGFHCTGWVRRGVVATEGAGAILVRRPSSKEAPAIHPHPISPAFRTKPERQAAWQTLLASLDPALPLRSTAALTPRNGPEGTGAVLLPPAPGLAFTASTAWSFLQALKERGEPGHGPFHLLVPGTNTAVSAVSFL